MGEAAGYVRVSTEQQRDNDSHVRQRERLEEWADREGHNLTVYEDLAISGQSDDRDGYDELMAEHKRYDVVVVRELSRLGRDLQRVLEDVNRFAENDVAFLSLKEDMIDTTSAQGKVFLSIIGAFNEFWANIARERTYRQIEQAEENGEKWGRPKKLDAEQREQVREWKSDGMSYGQIQLLIENDAEPFEDVESVSRSTLYEYCQEGAEA